MVRRAACLHFGAFCKQLTKENIKDELIPTFQALSADEQDSVRLLSVENCVAIALMFSQDENV
jgi:serine/threonine-protein phosphatase 2A regulatory subunit A